MTEPRWTTKLRQPVREWQWVTIYRDDVDVAVVLVGPEYAAELCARIEGERGSETCQTCGDDPKLAEIIKAFGFRPDIAALHIQRLKAERDALKDELTELEETDRRILADATPKDEDHCYCVVPLRKEVDRLKAENELLSARIEGREVVDEIVEVRMKNLGLMPARNRATADWARMKAERDQATGQMWDAIGQRDNLQEENEVLRREVERLREAIARAITELGASTDYQTAAWNVVEELRAALATPAEEQLCLDCGAQGELPHLKGCDEYDPTAESGEGEEG